MTAPPPPQALPTPYPAPTRISHSLLSNGTGGTGIPTTATAIYFADKILITISQLDGRIAQWFHIPLDTASPSSHPAPHTHHDHYLYDNPDDETKPQEEPLDLLPLSHLTPTTLLGGGGQERESIGQLYAVQIATAIRIRDVSEGRTVVVGLGLVGGKGRSGQHEREEFFEVMELVGKVL